MMKNPEDEKAYRPIPHIIIKNPPRLWSPCPYEENGDYCSICRKGSFENVLNKTKPLTFIKTGKVGKK